MDFIVIIIYYIIINVIVVFSIFDYVGLMMENWNFGIFGCIYLDYNLFF